MFQNYHSEHTNLLTTSRDAYNASNPDPNLCRNVDCLNGNIVSESESDNPEDYVGLSSVSTERTKKIITKKRMSLAQRNRRLKAKKIAERNFLCRRTSKRVDTILHRFPNIGKSIESYVSDANVGADAWRRTGMLTFDGNANIGQKVTYERIRQHLQEKYNHHFSYGTVVQLCVARNKHRKSAKNYKGIAMVTTRRARKGFELKYNPDNHWSGSLYRGLNFIQYSDGSDITNVMMLVDFVWIHSRHIPSMELQQ